MLNIVSFSGGKDSTALLLMMLERGIKVDYIVCVDTGKEFPQMYEHFHRVSCFCCPLKSISELRQLYQHYPAQWQIIKEMDIKAYNKF